MIPLPDPFVTDFDGTQRNFQTLSLATIIDAISGTIGDNKGDLIGFSAADTPVKVPKAASDGLVLRSLAAGTGGVEWAAASGGASLARLTADLTQTSSTDLTHANGQMTALDLTVAADEVWLVEYLLRLNGGGTAAHFKFDYTVPAAGAFFWQPLSAATSLPTWSGPVAGGADPVAMSTGAAVQTIAAANLIHGVAFTGIYIGGANAGTLRARFAQNASNGTGCKVLTNSIRRAQAVT